MNRSASGKAMNRPCSISLITCSCLPAAYCSTRASTSGTPKCSIAARAPAIRGMPGHDLLVHRRGEPLRAVQLVWSRMSRHSVSISIRNDSRQASSCGESTSTPSTSKIAPWNAMIPHQSSGRRRFLPPHTCWAHDGTRGFKLTVRERSRARRPLLRPASCPGVVPLAERHWTTHACEPRILRALSLGSARRSLGPRPRRAARPPPASADPHRGRPRHPRALTSTPAISIQPS